MVAKSTNHQEQERLDECDNCGADEDRRDENPGRKRAQSEPLQESSLAAHDDGDSESGEPSCHDSVGNESGHVVLNEPNASKTRDSLVTCAGAKQHEKDNREPHGEDGPHSVEPEEELLDFV